MAEAKKKCPRCKRYFSAYLVVAHLMDSGQEDSCPLCALKFKNKLFGLPPSTPFHGTVAKEMYSDAMKELEEIIKKEKEEITKKERKSELKVRARIKNKNEKTK